ncbi:hypothetical protein B0H10DRAFT_2226429 [Mycena sp. CBHHK59/15]|nr:hypothetical protein B0H10DRAFT_2226429 [Mycena sp. CBHHK59/15]
MLSGLDVDKPELTAIQLPSYRIKHGQWPAMTTADVNDEDSRLQDAEIRLRCTQADSGILAVQRKHIYIDEGGLTVIRWDGLVFAEGVTISRAAVGPKLSVRNKEQEGEEEEPELLVGTQMLKRSGYKQSPRTPKHLRDIAPDDVERGEMSPSKRGKKRKAKRPDGWIWLESLTRGQKLGNDEKLAAYKKEMQWFRAEVEMYRRLEQYERKHGELMRVIERFRHDGVVWEGLVDQEERQQGGVVNGKVTFAQMQAAIHKWLEHNTRVIFQSADSGAHHDQAYVGK